MKHQLLRLAFAVSLLLLCAWSRASVTQTRDSYTVVAWPVKPETKVPFMAQSGVMAIAAGYNHSVALKNDGSVVAWGNNQYGQVTGTAAINYFDSATASPVTLGGQVLSGVTAIAAGYNHTVALKDDGSVVAWGNNSHGQTKVPLAAQSGVVAIAAGGLHTVALKSDGSVVAWGSNQYGQRAIPIVAQSGVVAIAAGGLHTVALKNDGSVVAWGHNDYGQTTVPVAAQSGVTAIAAGDGHTVVLRNTGGVLAWGAGTSETDSFPNRGQSIVPAEAGRGVKAIAAGWTHTVALKNDGSVAVWGSGVYGETMTPPLAAQSGVAAIAAGAGHTVALILPTFPRITTQPVGQAVNVWQSPSFSVVATGYPLNYQWRKDGVDLAGATGPTYRLPYAQTNHAGNYSVVVSNAVGSVTSALPAVLSVDRTAAPGTVVAWGYWGDYSSLGSENSGQPLVPVEAQSGVVAIAIAASAGGYGDAHTVALKDDGSVVAWGGNCCGQTDVPRGARSGVTAIAAGWAHTVALKDDGTVVAWGKNDYGQVTGSPTTDGFPYSATASPVTLGGQVLSGVAAIAAGMWHTVALKSDGSVVAWGAGIFDLGSFPNVGQSLVPVAAQSGVVAIAAGFLHTVALRNDGTVVAWGDNRSGQVTGTSNIDDPPSAIASPVTLGGQVLSGVTALAAGASHTVASKVDGRVVAWGNNLVGQVTGTPATDEPYFAIANPVTLEGRVLSGVTTIAASSIAISAELGDFGSHTVALKNDGTVMAWGYNRSGQVTGTPTTDSPYSATANPVTLEDHVLSGITAISASHFQTVALIGGLRLRPSLHATTNGNELILSWPTNALGFTLQSTVELTQPVTWRDSPSIPAVVGTRFTVTNAITGGVRLYRLRKM